MYDFVCVTTTIMWRPTPPSAPCHRSKALKADQWAPLIILVLLLSGGGAGVVVGGGSSRLTSPHVLLRCPLACPNSAPWCLICMLTFAPPSLCLCSFSPARLHNRGGNYIIFRFWKIMFFSCWFTSHYVSHTQCQFRVSPPCFYRFLDLVILCPKRLPSEVTGMSEFRGSLASLPFSQWLISSYLDQRDKWMVCVCVCARLCVCMHMCGCARRQNNRKAWK